MNTPELKSRRFHLLACLTITAVGLAIYSNTTHSSFQFDDYRNIIDNPLLRDIRNIPQFFQDNGHTFPSRGLVTTSFAANYYFSGLSVESYHWVNISIHLLNGMLVYFFMLIILNQYISRGNEIGFSTDNHMVHILALFAALLFVSSPVQTESVTYIFQRNGLMASFFYLLSLILFIRAAAGPAIKPYLYMGSILSFVCSIWSKEMACTAPIIMFLYYQCFIAGKWRLPSNGLQLISPYIVVWAVSFYFGVVKNTTLEQISEWTFWEYLLTQSNVLIEYIKLLLMPLPSRLNVDFDFNLAETLWEFPTLLSTISILAILFTAVLLLDRSRLLAFLILWFFVILVPTSSIIPIRDVMVVRCLYLPSIGFYLLLVLAIHETFFYLYTRKALAQKLLWKGELAVLIGITLFYSICTYGHNEVWSTEITLWENTVKKSPNKISSHYSLGRAYQMEGQTEKAMKEYLICVMLYVKTPNIRDLIQRQCCSEAHSNLGAIYLGFGKYDLAITALRDAIKIYPENPNAHDNLGCAYFHTGKTEAAEVEFKRAIELNLKHPYAYSDLGILYESQSMLDEAINAYANAVKIDPKNTDAHMRLGLLMLNHKKDPVKAVHHLEEARRNCTDQETLKKINEAVKNIMAQETVTAPSR